ncbi:MAG: hypothetical protein U0441_26070 [Polyangiaceae bacterium]
MKHRIFALACTMVASLVIGCDSGDTIPAACMVATDQEGPYPVTFQFTVAAEGTTLYVDWDCIPYFSLLTCDDGYVAPVAIDDNCTADCTTQPTECPICGQCPGGPPAITSAAPKELSWSGHLYDFGKNQSGCSCHDERVAHAGKYRIKVPVYATLEDANTHQNGVERTVDFDLPAPNGIVNIQLDAAN